MSQGNQKTQTTSGKLGLTTATIISMNAMIGAGIFAIPVAFANSVGPAGIITCALVAVAIWFIGQSFARTAQLFPEEGSFYAYAKQWGGHRMGLLASGLYLVGLLIAMGLLTQMVGNYLAEYNLGISAYALGLFTLVALTLLNSIGVSVSKFVQHVLIACTVFSLVTTTVVCLSKASLNNLVPFAPYGAFSIIQAIPVVIFAFFGFECAASLFSVIDKPEQNIPKAFTYAISAVADRK